MRPLLLAAALLSAAGGCSPPPPRAPAPAAFVFPARLQALGTEPFWSIMIDGPEIAYSSPDEPEARTARVTREETGGELRLTGVLGGAPVTVRIVPKTCSDGMSDRVYSYSAKVQLGERSLQGCARQPGMPEAGDRP